MYCLIGLTDTSALRTSSNTSHILTAELLDAVRYSCPIFREAPCTGAVFSSEPAQFVLQNSEDTFPLRWLVSTFDRVQSMSAMNLLIF